jgi:hypothetical protein
MNIPASQKPKGTKLLELQAMIDALTSSIPPGNIQIAPKGMKIPQINPYKQ